MTKNITASFTFSPSPPRIIGANGTFLNTFAVGDPIVVLETSINDGFFTVTGLDTVNNAYLTIDPPPKSGGPITATVRTP
jgi:hypothetical protein